MRLKEGGNRPRTTKKTTDDRPRTTKKDHGLRTTDHAVQQAIGKEGTTDDGPRRKIGNRQLSTGKGGGRPRPRDDRPRSAIGYRQ